MKLIYLSLTLVNVAFKFRLSVQVTAHDGIPVINYSNPNQNVCMRMAARLEKHDGAVIEVTVKKQ